MNALDINIYFKDKFGRLCVLASAGGVLPKYLLDDNSLKINEDELSKNNDLDNIIYKLPKKFKIGRNPLLPSILRFQYPDAETTENSIDGLDNNEDYNFTTRYNIEFSKLNNDKILTDYETPEFSDYFLTFDDLAARGLFVYDKLNINHPEDDTFVLVSYPIYDTENPDHRKWYDKIKSCMDSAPKLDIPIIERFSNNIEKNSFKDLNLIKIIDSI